MSFANLKSKSADISKLVSAATEAAGSAGAKKASWDDDRVWKPTVDESGNGYAVVRFLPANEGQDLPWVRYWDHGFKGPTGKWYIEKSLTTIGQTDPVGELNSRLWNSGIEDDKETARRQKRRLHYVSNIMVISDPANPANNGKVFMYVYGKKIFDKVMDLMQPEFPGETPVNPFDFWNGADFQLKIRNVAGYRNYDKSDFKAPGPLLEADEVKLETVYNAMHDTFEYADPTKYKSYDELKQKLEMVLGMSTGMGSAIKNDALTQTATAAPMHQANEPTFVQQEAPAVGATVATDEDETLSYFAKMAAEQ
tara:strand:- start:34943 stop:35872 length:930 start_codon:yes stop_codon:yes gene_type:complete